MSDAGVSRRRRLAPVAASMLLAALLPALAQAAKPPMPELRLREPLRGEAAVLALGRQLPAVAAHYGMSAQRLAEILRQDRNAWIDVQGRLLYIDEFPESGDTSGPAAPAAAASAPYGLEQTFQLHSKPGSQRVMYLDFDGHVASNTAWSSGVINAPPYDLDGVPLNFSDAEKERIQAIWQRVAEDYAPFDVDITTEEPPIDDIHRTSSSDARYGTRVVITHSSVGVCSGCGGVAYVGTFDYYSSSKPGYYQPAWVLYDRLGSGNEKYVAEAIAHEAGHNLGLSHDGRTSPSEGYYQGHGSGATGWAPIMGVGYYKSLVQWSRGEYPSANNTQDDFAVIQSNGALLRADDYGSSLAAAAPLQGSAAAGSVSVDQPGLIERAADADVFAFVAGAGSASFSLGLAPRSPNLDAELSLYDGAGSLLAAANDPAGLGATLNVTLAGGSYYLKVDGVGDLDPAPGYPDYGSVGAYRISGSYPAGSGALAPVAVASATPTSGTVPLTVAFSGADSSDADGQITAYAWDFGDGASAGGAEATHTYTTVGSYTATLTVTDSQGLQDTESVPITVQPDARTTTLHVQDIAMSVQQSSLLLNLVGNTYQCIARVTVQNGVGTAAGGATVSGAWSGVVSSSGSASTDAGGVASFTMPSTSARGTCTFTVNAVGGSGYSYDPAANVETSDSLSY